MPDLTVAVLLGVLRPEAVVPANSRAAMDSAREGWWRGRFAGTAGSFAVAMGATAAAAVIAVVGVRSMRALPPAAVTAATHDIAASGSAALPSNASTHPRGAAEASTRAVAVALRDVASVASSPAVPIPRAPAQPQVGMDVGTPRAEPPAAVIAGLLPPAPSFVERAASGVPALPTADGAGAAAASAAPWQRTNSPVGGPALPSLPGPSRAVPATDVSAAFDVHAPPFPVDRPVEIDAVRRAPRPVPRARKVPVAPAAASVRAAAPVDAPASAAVQDLGRGVTVRRLDVLVAIRDATSVVVPGHDGLPAAFRVGQQLPSGARLLSVDTRLGTAETDRGPMRLE